MNMAEQEINILLIEDEDPHAELIQRAFDEQGSQIQIQRAKSLTEARAKIRERSPSLIIADWRLPDGESMELLPDHHDPLSTPVILMTSYGNERIAVEALKSGALDYVVKSPESMLDMPHLAERAIAQWAARAERARMQEALRESESQFRLMAENASDMIARLSTGGHILYISPACQTILGYFPEELVGTNSFDLLHEKDRRLIGRLFKTGNYSATHTVAYQARRKDGNYVWLETSARAVLDPKTNSTVEIQTASRNITERKTAEKALQEAHNDLREAYEKTIEGWVRALDLRDRETEGHTQRVTELTVSNENYITFQFEPMQAG
jgi:PAS domain S-box-containing protein